MADITLRPELAVEKEIKGRSLWSDARHRLLQNHAAVASAIILLIIVLLSFFGPYFAPHTFDEVSWDFIDAPPSFEQGFYFGTDQNGRDLFVRTLDGGRVSITIGVVATLVSLLIGVTWGATAGFVGGRLDGVMM